MVCYQDPTTTTTTTTTTEEPEEEQLDTGNYHEWLWWTYNVTHERIYSAMI